MDAGRRSYARDVVAQIVDRQLVLPLPARRRAHREVAVMTTLIGVYNSDGCVGRLDAKCYEAQGGSCSCICGGMNHGAGLEQAWENRVQLTRKQLKGIEARGGYVPDDVRQLVLL
jgi:hypothetical protein